MASHEAARRAVKAGYTDVSVMADGIVGWKSAGAPTVPAANSQVHNS
jgi:rhodanese-related sulfurtransferase